jgi:hypothetical protein
MAEPRIADNFVDIAQRLRELQAERDPLQAMPMPVRPEPHTIIRCGDCRDTGWLPSNAPSSGWKRCHYCGVDKLRPSARR